jgi:hypothetical protein
MGTRNFTAGKVIVNMGVALGEPFTPLTSWSDDVTSTGPGVPSALTAVAVYIEPPSAFVTGALNIPAGLVAAIIRDGLFHCVGWA